MAAEDNRLGESREPEPRENGRALAFRAEQIGGIRRDDMTSPGVSVGPTPPRRGPGRPRKPAYASGPITGVNAAQPPSLVQLSIRLLELEAAAAYLGVSPWTVRDLEAAGTIKRVRVPLPHGRELRKLLFDKMDLDRLIEAWKT